MKNDEIITSVYALGGLGEVGKNMYCIEYKNEIIVIDAGVMFPENDLLGVDYVIQDITYLKQNENKIKALFITHGHEDHIGGITYLLQALNLPSLYAPQIAADLINKKLEDKNVNYENIKIIDKNSYITFDDISVEFIQTTHSIPDSFGIVVHTPCGVIVSTGDFKFDLTPIGPMADIHKMARLGDKGVKLLLSDSTNALSDGYSKSESTVDEALSEMFARTTSSRIILATFASNIYRIKHIIETCKKNNRKIITFGRSMEENFICEVISLTRDTISLDEEYDNEEHYNLHNQLGVEQDIDTQILINDSINSLEEPMRSIIKYRFFNEYTQSEVANILGISQVKVSRLENKGKTKIKEYIAA